MDILRVLIVDDSRTIRSLARVFLDHENIAVTEAVDGYEGLSLFQQSKPDIVFVDVLMPRLDGHKFCAIAKANHLTAGTPIYMLTSKSSVIDRARSALLQADGFITKPFKRADLQAVLSRHFPRFANALLEKEARA
jgi:twitching motility two-component system response regulator PilG